MNALRLGARQASMVWLEPHRVHAGGQSRTLAPLSSLPGPPSRETLAEALEGLPAGPTHWVVDDAWMPSLLLRDIVEVPKGPGRDDFFKWRYTQTLALEAPQMVQALALEDNAWLLAGMDEATRNSWLHTALTLGRPIRSLVPRWLWLYNRLAPTRELPGMLLSLRPAGDGAYAGTLAAWGRNLTLLRQWPDPAAPEAWLQDRVLPSAAYLHREAHAPHELLVWGASSWPGSTLPTRLLPQDLPAREAL